AKRRGGSVSRRATATRPSTTSRRSTSTARPPPGWRANGRAPPSRTARPRGAVSVTRSRRRTPRSSASGAYTISTRGTCATVRPPAARRRSSSTSERPSVPPTWPSRTRASVARSRKRTTALRSSARTAPVRLPTASASATSTIATSRRASQRRSRRMLERLPHAQVDLPARVAAHRADAAGVEALEERDVAAPAEGLLGGQAEPERGRQVRDQRLVAPPLALEAHEGELAAEEAAHGLDAGARHPAARRVEKIVGPVPLGAEARAGEEAGVGRQVGEPARYRPVHARERVVLDAVEGVGGERGERLQLEARREARAVAGVGLLVLLVLGGDQAETLVRAGEVGLEEVGGDRAAEEGRARGEAELARAAQEVVVAPAGQAAELLLGVVADPEADLVPGRLAQPDAYLDARIAALVLVDADGAEE